MKILCIEPLGVKGHLNFNKFMLQAIEGIGDITLIAPENYLKKCSMSKRLSIPKKYTDGQSKSKVKARVSQIRSLNFILKNICIDDYDAIIFLAYETISFCLCWPRNRKVYVFEHNNIENSYYNTIKRSFYRYLPGSTKHFVFLPHIKEYINQFTKREAFYIPHPHYREDFFIQPDKCIGNSVSKSNCKLTIFSPSSSTPEQIQNKIKSFVSKKPDKYYAICKYNENKETNEWETKIYFKDYVKLLSNCDVVFTGAQFNYRISGIAYEALSYGKGTAMFYSSFAKALNSEYPNLIFLIKSIEDIANIKFNFVRMQEDQSRFLRKHSATAIKHAILNALEASGL